MLSLAAKPSALPAAAAPPRTALAPSELAALFDTVEEAYCVLDCHFRIVAVDGAMAAHFGREPAAIVGLTAFELNPRFADSLFHEPIAATTRMGVPAICTG